MSEIIRMGEHAKLVLDNKAFVKAMSDMRNEIFNAFRQAEMGDTERMEEIHNLMRSSDIFESKLRLMIDNAAVELAKLNQPSAKRIKR
jgi:hypothetical protein